MTRKSQPKASGRNDAWFAGAGLAGLILLGVAGHARAQDASGPQAAWNVAVTSDYVFRGVSQTQDNPAIQGGVDLTNGGVYAGAWASDVDFADSTDGEIDLYGGWRPELAGWNFDLGAVAYLYPGQPQNADFNYVEFKAAASRAFGAATLGAVVYYSPDFFGASEHEATYVEANAAVTPADKWTISGAVGRQYVSSNLDYTTWNLGVAWQLTDRLTLDARYHDTDQHDFGDIYGSRAVATLKAAF